MAAHQNTDATWHSINFGAGFLRVMADLDFNQEYDRAHTILDTGADTLLAKRFASISEFDGFDWLSSKWSVPVEDIIEIYQSMGIKLDRTILGTCAIRGYAGLVAVRKFGADLAPKYAEQTPFMSTQLEHYYLGSLQEASTTAVQCWLIIETWIKEKTVPSGDDLWNYCAPMRSVHRHKAEQNEHDLSPLTVALDHLADQNMEPNLDFVLSVLHSTFDANATTLVIERDVRTDSAATRFESPMQEPTFSHVSSFLASSIPYSEFGSSLTFVDDSASGRIAVGSPRDADFRDRPAQGAVYVVPVSSIRKGLVQKLEHKLVLKTAVEHCIEACADALINHRQLRSTVEPCFTHSVVPNVLAMRDFGRSSVNIKINGLPYLAVASSDKVELFLVTSDSVHISPDMTIVENVASHLSSVPIASNLYSFEHYGSDILIVFRPWSGHVYLFTSSALMQKSISLDSATLVLASPSGASQALSRFGSSITYNADHRVLFIGQAGNRHVFGFELSRDLSSRRQVILLQDPSLQKLNTGFGSSGLLSIGHDLYVGSSTEDVSSSLPQSGKVRHYRLSRGRLNGWTLQLVREAAPTGPSAFAHFASTIVQANLESGIYISAVNYKDRGAIFFLPRLSHLKRREYKQHVLLQHDRISNGIASPLKTISLDKCLIGPQAGGSRFGDDILVQHGQWLAIGAPGDTGLTTSDLRAGKVYIYDAFVCSK